MQTSNLTIYYDNKDLYVYYIINIYTKLQTNEGWNPTVISDVAAIHVEAK